MLERKSESTIVLKAKLYYLELTNTVVRPAHETNNAKITDWILNKIHYLLVGRSSASMLPTPYAASVSSMILLIP